MLTFGSVPPLTIPCLQPSISCSVPGIPGAGTTQRKTKIVLDYAHSWIWFLAPDPVKSLWCDVTRRPGSPAGQVTACQGALQFTYRKGRERLTFLLIFSPELPQPSRSPPASSAQILSLTLLLLWNPLDHTVWRYLAVLLSSLLLIVSLIVSLFTLQCQGIFLGVRRRYHSDRSRLCFSSSSLVVFGLAVCAEKLFAEAPPLLRWQTATR